MNQKNNLDGRDVLVAIAILLIVVVACLLYLQSRGITLDALFNWH